MALFQHVGYIEYSMPVAHMLRPQCQNLYQTMAKQVSFDLFAGYLYLFVSAKTEVEFLAAFLASILACLASHPGDVVLTATYKGSRSTGYFTSVVSNLYDQKGFNAFFAGINARFFHVGAIITSQLVLYDVIKQLLGLPATGTH